MMYHSICRDHPQRPRSLLSIDIIGNCEGAVMVERNSVLRMVSIDSVIIAKQ
jgi:hypothetical protein